LNYYNIPSEKCSSDNVKITNSEDIKTEWSSQKSGLKIILIVIWSIIALCVLVVVWFAIKAKISKWWEEE
jgi:cell division septal protein FtsQ